MDIRSAKQVNEAGEELSNEFEVDILFNTAGFCHLNDSSEDSDDRIERILGLFQFKIYKIDQIKIRMSFSF